MNYKIKVAIICHFSNADIRSRLKLRNNIFKNIIHRIMKQPLNMYSDFAPWIPAYIRHLEIMKDVETHVIFPHNGMIKNKECFCENGVFYHAFGPVKTSIVSYFFNKCISKPLLAKYKANYTAIKASVDEINPNIVILSGAENLNYSPSVLYIDNYPIFLLCQTVYANPMRYKFQNGNVDKERWDIEQKIFNKIHYFGCHGLMYYDLIKKYVPDAVVFPHDFPGLPLPDLVELPIIFDFVFFSVNVNNKKGIDSAINALQVVKESKPNVSLLVIGGIDKEFKPELEKMVSDAGLSDNITFHPFFQEKKDMLQYIKQARFALLPVKMDVLSGTICDAMAIGLPVVTHITSGTPILNRDKECVLLSKIGDTQAMASNMLKLLNFPEFAEILKKNAKDYYSNKYDNRKIVNNTINCCKAIIDEYTNNIPVPSELLFNPNDYPAYN